MKPPAETAPLTVAVPVDPRITVGTLPNGLRYYIRRNTKPAGRAELRLVVNAGSVLEDDDQRGLAHFVEHMAFNGTRHFPKQDIISFLQSTGMRFGAHVNANTSFDQTVFQLQIPTDDASVIDRSFLVLEDWATGVTFEADEIDKERGVVLEEWRLGLGADARLLQQQMPVLLKGSRYAERLPIGTPDSIRTFAPERLKQFYRDWYRPDLMAVIAVGDFDKAAVEALIKTHFARIPAAASPKPRPRFDVPEHPGTRFTIATDPEATVTVVNVSSAIAARDQTTIGAYRQQTAERVVSGLLSARLGELSQKPDAPFLAAGTNRSLFVSAAEMTSMTAVVPDARHREGPGRALRRSRPHDEVRHHRDRARSLQAGDRARLRAPRRPDGRAPVGDARRRVRPQLHAAGADPRHRLRAGAGQALPADADAGRGQRDRQDVDAGSQPRGRGQRAAEGGRGDPRRGEAERDHHRRQRQRPHRLRRHGHLAAAPRASADAGPHRQDRGAPAVRDHRVDAVERRPRGDQADDVQPRSDPVPRLQPGRHVAGARHRLHRRRHRQPGHLAGRPGRLDADRSRQEAGRPHRVGPSRHRRDAGRPHRRQRQGRSRDAVPADLPDGGRAARRPRRVPRDGDAAAGDAGESQRRARGGVQRRGQRDVDAEPSPLAAADARARRADEPREVAGVLQGSLRRR